MILAYKDKLTFIHNRTIHLILSPKFFKKISNDDMRWKHSGENIR